MKKEKDVVKQSKLVVTNYDNFKDASVFIKEYFEAEKRMKEISDFFQSFYMSKLILSEDVFKTHPAYVSLGRFDSSDSWFKQVAQREISLYSFNMASYSRCKDKASKREDAEEIKHDISEFLRGDWSCYFVLDCNNILHEFVPVTAKDTIKVKFNEKEISISGYYFKGTQTIGDFGQPEEYITRVTRTIVIDPNNNNVIEVNQTTLSHKTVKLSRRDSKIYYSGDIKTHAFVEIDSNIICDTFDFKNPYDSIRDYIKERFANYEKGYNRVIFFTPGHTSTQPNIYVARDADELDSINKEIIKKFNKEFKETFGKTLKVNHLDRFKPIIWLRDDVIRECYKKPVEEFEVSEEDGIPEEDFPIVKWYNCKTKKFILEENL